MALPFLTINQGKDLYDKAEATKQRADSLVNGSNSSSNGGAIVLDFSQLTITEHEDPHLWYDISSEDLDLEELFNRLCSCSVVVMTNFDKIHDTVDVWPDNIWYYVPSIYADYDAGDGIIYFEFWQDDYVYLRLVKALNQETGEWGYMFMIGFNGL